MDSIYIDRLVVDTHIGTTDEEQSRSQKLHVSVELFYDISTVAETDSVDDTIDYEAVCNTVKKLATTARHTIEKFAEDTADAILKSYKTEKVKVTVWKYILEDTHGVAVTIMRP